MIQKMGSLRDLVDKIPMLGGQIPEGVDLDDRELVRIEAMIQSMTRSEKADPYLLVREPGRVKRIAKGSAQPEQGVGELVQKFLFMKQMIGNVGQNMGLMGKIPGMKQVGMAKNLRKAMAGGRDNGPLSLPTAITSVPVPDAIMCINRGGCNMWSGECCLAPAQVTLDAPFQLVLFVSRLLEASGLRVGLVGGSASSPVEVPG